jgi:hypothetical protein
MGRPWCTEEEFGQLKRWGIPEFIGFLDRRIEEWTEHCEECLREHTANPTEGTAKALAEAEATLAEIKRDRAEEVDRLAEKEEQEADWDAMYAEIARRLK